MVEFDHSINAAVKRLRDVLLDSADKPRYVETIAKRGYRFIGDVETPLNGIPHPGVSAAIESVTSFTSADGNVEISAVLIPSDLAFRNLLLALVLFGLLLSVGIGFIMQCTDPLGQGGGNPAGGPLGGPGKRTTGILIHSARTAGDSK